MRYARPLSTFLFAALLGSAALSYSGRAAAQADLTPPLPNVLLLIDTSGSMEYLADGTLPKLDAQKNEAPAKPAEGTDRGMTSLGDVPGATAGLGGVGGASPTQTQTKSGGSAGSASGRWDIVVRGDRARQAGDCVAAREEYALALEDDEARVRARALAGLGLCDAMSGDEASADANYERARGLDDEIGTYIESQNQRSRGAEKRKSKPAKKSKASADALDPFE